MYWLGVSVKVKVKAWLGLNILTNAVFLIKIKADKALIDTWEGFYNFPTLSVESESIEYFPWGHIAASYILVMFWHPAKSEHHLSYPKSNNEDVAGQFIPVQSWQRAITCVRGDCKPYRSIVWYLEAAFSLQDS